KCQVRATLPLDARTRYGQLPRNHDLDQSHRPHVGAAGANSHIETPHNVKIGLIHDDQTVHAMLLHALPEEVAHRSPCTALSVHLTLQCLWSILRRHIWQYGVTRLFRGGPEGCASSVGDSPSQHRLHWRSAL